MARGSKLDGRASTSGVERVERVVAAVAARSGSCWSSSSVRPWRARLRALVAAAWLLATGCAGAQPGATGGAHRCEAGSRTFCVTAPVCAWDAARQCERCRCGDAPYVPVAR